MKPDRPYKDSNTGVTIYPELPTNMRVAVMSDFVDERGVELVDVPFLAKSFHYDHYELHKSKAGTADKWKIWLEEKHLFVK